MLLIAVRVKTGTIKQSIDWVTATDVDMVSTVLSEIDFIQQVHLWSDACLPLDVGKLEEEYNKDLLMNKYPTKAKLSKFLKN